MSLDDLRARIDEIDREVVRLLNERAQIALSVGGIKRDEGENDIAYVPGREREVLERVVASSDGTLPDESLRAIYREIISASRELQRQHVVAYFGGPGSYTHAAALRHFGQQCDFTGMNDIQAIFSAVDRSAAHFGVVPIENSTDGVITATLDEFMSSQVRIVGETHTEIHHYLLANCRLAEVRTVYSHPQPIAQCVGYLRRTLPDVEVREVASSPLGAKLASEDPSGAAISTKLSAEIFGLSVLDERIEDHTMNRTRFWVLGRSCPKPSGRDKTSLAFSTRHEHGSLFRSLEAFAAHRINLVMIQSRPVKHTPWEYVFYIDFLGHPDEPHVQAALRELERNSVFVRVLGSYPEAV
jgi:chorismate mutase/prephenate dehydratase